MFYFMEKPLPPDSQNWRPIPHTDKYLVSNDGRIWSVESGKELKTKVAKTGYVNINLNYGVGTRFVHHLVAEAWIGPKPTPSHVIDHKDEDRTNNKASNLEWVTRRENTQRAGRSGTLGKRRQGRKCSLTPEQVYDARRRRADGESYASIGRSLNTNPSTIRNAVHGMFYGEYTEVPPLPLTSATHRTGAGGARNIGPQKPTDKHPSEFIEPLPNESWRRLEGNVNGYWVSDHGRIFSAKSRRLKKAVVNTKEQGYLRIQLRNTENGYTSFMLHRLVADYFLPPPPSPDHIVGHMNEDPQDARAENLCWISRRENAIRSDRFRKHGPTVGEIHNFIAEYARAEHDVSICGTSIDIFCPDKRIGFCYQDTLLSSERAGVGSRVLVQKQDAAKQEGIQLYFLFGNEWHDKQDIIKSMIKNKLCATSKRIGARKTLVQEVPTKQATSFLDENHVQGSVGARYKYGCYFEGELVALATFGVQRYGSKEENHYELIRYAVKQNLSVVGGFSRLLKHFVYTHKPEGIVSYADRRWSSGSVYETNGFSLARKANPNYFYFRPEEPHDLKSRVLFQKHKLPQLLERFDPRKTEFENMRDHGWDRIWDCGNLVYELSGLE